MIPDAPTSPRSVGRLLLMENLLGLLRIRIVRGVNLAVRDVRSSDPYVVVKMGKQVRFSLSFFFHDHLLFFSSFFFLLRIGGFVVLIV